MTRRQSMIRKIRAMAIGLALLLVGSPGWGVEAELEQLLPAREISSLIEVGNRVVAGLDGGGLLIHEAGNPAVSQRLTAGQNLSGNNVSDLAWTGQNVWVATLGGGMTRIFDLNGQPEYRQYTSNLGSIDITAVTGTVIAGTERVFYGMAGAGLGQINNGLSGNLYTAEQDGLLANDINALQFLGGDLFVATPIGVSRFANNEFTTQNAGLDDLSINDLALDGAGNLLAAGNSGVYRWDGATASWTRFGDFGAAVVVLSADADAVYALDLASGGAGRLHAFAADTWTDIPLPELRCNAVYAGTDLWIGGRVVSASNGRSITNAYLGRQDADAGFSTWLQDASQVFTAEGVTFGSDGTPWTGSWDGQAISGRNQDGWTHIFETPTAANDTLTLFPSLGNILSMAAGPDGDIWASQFALGGILKYDPAANRTERIDPENSGLGGRGIVNMITHPDGPLLVMHDWSDEEKVEVLVDPDNWEDPASWINLPRDTGLGGGLTVWDAVVERRDLIWFAVEAVGLVRWDINGDAAGPDDPLTWFDQSDDRWDEPVSSFPRTSLDPGKTLGLAVDPSGNLWAGGNGLVQFTYEEFGQALAVETLLAITEKQSTLIEGLVSGSVSDVAVDANGDAWAATAAGLNRIRQSGDEVVISAWIDLENYLGNPNFGVLYSPSVIAPLPGVTYRKLVADAEGRHLLLSADQGTTLITVGSGNNNGGGGADGDSAEGLLAGAYCYPNPWTPENGAAGLKIGGLPAAADADGGVSVWIYNLEGQPVQTYAGSFNRVISDTPFWYGENVQDGPVATGMYLIKISWGQDTAIRTLAVVR